MPIFRFQTQAGQRIVVNARRESTVVFQDGDTSYTFDYDGRLIGAFLGGRNYRRGLANEILEKQGGPRPGVFGRVRRLLTRAEVQKLEEEAYGFTSRLSGELDLNNGGPGSGDGQAGAYQAAIQALARVQTYDYARLEREREVYHRLYRPVTILPPDQYLAVYLQATEGCLYNRCRFCGFYRDRPFRLKSPDEFRRHITDVRAFLGGGMTLRRSIFLGDANALMIPQVDLVPMLRAVQDEFEILPARLEPDARGQWKREHPGYLDGIYSFVDAVPARRKTPDEFAELARLGLRRVYVGLESGDAALLRFLGKPNTPADVIELVRDVKTAGVAVGLVILVGPGGKRFEEAHIRETAGLLNALALDSGDLIYFSEVVDYPGSTYGQRVESERIPSLSPGEINDQIDRLRARLSFPDPERAPRISYYDIRLFI
ncbi:MAG: radical SAM protein [Rudaea sp.]